MHGFDVEQALWIDQTPSAVRQSELLIGRLKHARGDSLFVARLTKESATARSAIRDAAWEDAKASGQARKDFDAEWLAREFEEANAQNLADPYEYFGYGPLLYGVKELIDAVNLLKLQVIGLAGGGDDAPAFKQSWRPGDELKAPDEFGGAEVIDLEDFDPIAMGLT